MQKKLKLPRYRRVAGGVLIAAGYCLGIGLIVIDALDIESIYDAVAVPFEPRASTLGAMLVIGASVITPSVLYPCIFDKFPDWFDRLPKEMVHNFAQMLGVR